MKLSVVIPCFNVELYLERTIRCLDIQTYRDFDVILINDGSTDRTQEIAERIVEKRENYRLFSYENAGLSEARNRGLEYADGDYVYFLDADDCIAPNMFQCMVELIERNDYPDAVRCGAFWFVCDNIDINNMPLIKISHKETILENNEIFQTITNSIIGYSKDDICEYYSSGKFNFKYDFQTVWIYFYKKRTLDEYNLQFVKGLRMIEDRIFNATFMAYANKVVYTNDRLYFYMKNPQSLVNIVHKDYIKMYEDKVNAVKQRNLLRELYKKRHNIDIFSSYIGSNVLGCLQVAVILSNIPFNKAKEMFDNYLNLPSVQDSIIDFPVTSAPLKFKLPMLLLQHNCNTLLLILVHIAKALKLKLTI